MAPIRGSQRPGSPMPTSGASAGGDNDGAGEMLPSLTPSPGCTRGQGCRGSKGAGPLPYPPSHSKVWGRGATSSVSEGGSERAGHLPSHATQQGLEPRNTGLSKVRAVTEALCYTPRMEGGSAGEVEGRIRFPLTLDLDKFPTHDPSPKSAPSLLWAT